ncbi:MAG: hypothetical protein HC785_09280 [Calothrix sp. CSU_2_0]|nr:hypothetical protein [Calothrix sp. CSU_2_0]
MTSLFGQDLANAIAKNTLTNVTTYTPQSVNVKERVVKPSLVAQHLANLNAIAKKKQLQFQLTVTNTH